MSENFGLKIGLEGEKEFKKSLAEINNSFKVLGSEMKLVDSQFDKNDKHYVLLSPMPPSHSAKTTAAPKAGRYS